MEDVSVIRGMFEWGIIWVVPGLAFCFMALGIMVAVLWMFRPKEEMTGIERQRIENESFINTLVQARRHCDKKLFENIEYMERNHGH